MPQQTRMPKPVIRTKKQPGHEDPADSNEINETAMETEYRESDQSSDNGNTWLGLGAGTGAWGGFTWLAAGHFCPVCLIVTPVLLGVGIYQKFIKQEKRTTPKA